VTVKLKTRKNRKRSTQSTARCHHLKTITTSKSLPQNHHESWWCHV